MARHTLRGRVDGGETKRLIADDGNLNSGHRVTSFRVWPIALATSDDPEAILSLDYDATPSMDAGDNRQIAWAAMTTTASQRISGFNIIDPDHVVLRDLYIYNVTGSPLNYLIELEPTSLSDDQAVLTLIKERSQDDLK